MHNRRTRLINLLFGVAPWERVASAVLFALAGAITVVVLLDYMRIITVG